MAKNKICERCKIKTEKTFLFIKDKIEKINVCYGCKDFINGWKLANWEEVK